MIMHTKQDWSIGSRVKVGFLTLTVIGQTQHEYQLMSDKGHSYEFTPHLGLARV